MPLDYSASIVLDKGLSNYCGHNNCFLNSAVQVFWHLQVFRRNFLAMKDHDCVEGSCIYCALQDIFKDFKESGGNILHPDMLRVTLACSFQDQAKFQLGELDDAAECYEKILSRIHFHLSGGASDDFCTLNHCITHVKFAMSLIQQSSCQCKATSEPLPYVQLVHYISTSSIVECSKMMPKSDFSEVLRHASNQGSSESTCPLKCGLKSKLTRTLVNCPDVISIGLIWNSDQPDLDHIREFVSTIGQQLTLHNLFDSAIDVDKSDKSVRELVGVVCYYFKHYSTFFKRSNDGKWISFDDASVTEIGETWDKVIDKCCKGKYQPLLLIYQNKYAELINTKTAPKKTSFIKKSFDDSKSSMKMSKLVSQSPNKILPDETGIKIKVIKEKKAKNMSSSYDASKVVNNCSKAVQQHSGHVTPTGDATSLVPFDLNSNVDDMKSYNRLNDYNPNTSLYDGVTLPFLPTNSWLDYTDKSLKRHNGMKPSSYNHLPSMLPSSNFPGGTSQFRDTKGILNEVHAKVTSDNRNRLLKIHQNQVRTVAQGQHMDHPNQQIQHQHQQQYQHYQPYQHQHCLYKDNYPECRPYGSSDLFTDNHAKTLNYPVQPPSSLQSNQFSDTSKDPIYHNHTLPQLYRHEHPQHSSYQHHQYQHSPRMPDDRFLTSYENGQQRFLEPANNAAFLKKISDSLSSDHYDAYNSLNSNNNFKTFPLTKTSRNMAGEIVHGRPPPEEWDLLTLNDDYLNSTALHRLNINNSNNLDDDESNKNNYVNKGEFAFHRCNDHKDYNINNISNKLDNSKSNISSASSSYENITPFKGSDNDKEFVVVSSQDVLDSKNLMEFNDESRRLVDKKILALYKT